MKHLRHTIGWLAIIFGIIGMLACLAAIVGAWIWSQGVRRTVDDVTDHVTAFTSRLSSRSTEAADWLAASQSKIKTAQQEVRATLAEAAEKKGIDPAELEAVAKQVRRAVDGVRDWLAVAESTGAFVDLIREVMGSLGTIAQPDLAEGTGQALAGVIGEVRATGAALEELSRAIEQARSDLPPDGGEIGAKARSVLSKSAVVLARLQEHTEAFGGKLVEIEASILSVRSNIHHRLTIALIIATVLLVWQAIAQWSLARWGGQLVQRGVDPANLGCDRESDKL